MFWSIGQTYGEYWCPRTGPIRDEFQVVTNQESTFHQKYHWVNNARTQNVGTLVGLIWQGRKGDRLATFARRRLDKRFQDAYNLLARDTRSEISFPTR